MRRLWLLLLLCIPGHASAITYTLVNGTFQQNIFALDGQVKVRIWTQNQIRRDVTAIVNPNGTWTGHTYGIWTGWQAAKDATYTDQAGTTTGAATVTPEVNKNSSLTNPKYGASVEWDNDVVVANPGGGANHRALAQGYARAASENVFKIDPNLHPGATGKIITWNYVFSADLNHYGGNTWSLDNADPWLYAECGASRMSAIWQAADNRWWFTGVVADADPPATTVNNYVYGEDMGAMSGWSVEWPVGHQVGVSTATSIPCKAIAGKGNYWLTTDVQAGGTGANPMADGSDLLIFVWSTFTVHD